MVLSIPLQLEAASLDAVSFDGIRDSHGEFLTVKVGVRIPVQTLVTALSDLQLRFGEFDARSRGEGAAKEGAASPSIVVKNTFLDVDEGRSSSLLARTTTAPATCRGDVAVETVLEEASEEGEECGGEDDVPAPAPLMHTVTHDPFMYKMADATTWLPTGQEEVPCMPVDAQGIPMPPPGMPPMPPNYMMHGMPAMVPPWGFAPGWYDPTLDPSMTPGLAFQQTLPPDQLPHNYDFSSNSAEPAVERPGAVQALRRTFSLGSGCMRVHWTVGADVLESAESGRVESPNFDLTLGDDCPSVPFRLRLWAEDSSGASCFRDTQGNGSIELVCEQILEAVPDVKFRMAVGSGPLRQPARGPVCHNFEESSASSLPKDQAIWDFSSAVDTSSNSFVVCLEVFPAGASVPAPAQPSRLAPSRSPPAEKDPEVIVKNTFLDVNEQRGPSAMRRTTTAPAEYAAKPGGQDDEVLMPGVREEEEEEAAPVAPLVSEADRAVHQSSMSSMDRTATLDPYSYEASNPLTWLPEEGGVPAASSQSLAVVPERPPLKPQVVHRTFNVETGSMRLEWVVSSKKLASGDSHAAVSPAFDLSFGEEHPTVSFKMLIHPKVVDERKGGGSFKTAGGRGYVELACEEMLPPEAPQVAFRVAIGTGQQRSPFRGPVSHDFSQKKVSGLPKEQALWNFNSVVDKESKTFVVCLEVLPRGGEELAIGAEAPAKPLGPKKW